MRHWFFPCASGDFRLTRVSDTTSLLTVEDPTDSDKERLRPFLAAIKEKKLIDDLVGVQPKGKTEIEIPESMNVLGPLMAAGLHGDTDVWTALRFNDGKMLLNDGFEMTTTAPTVAAAATIETPRKGCPAPAPAQRRASQVLQAFCTSKQWRQYQAEGRLTARGNVTGRTYHVYHRDEANRRGLRYALVSVADQTSICTWDDRVPAEEETLGLKLAIEHRERWLLGLPRGPVRARV